MCSTLSSLPTTGNQPAARLGASTKRNEVCNRLFVKYHHYDRNTHTVIHSWLYTLFLALDGNFRMSRKGVSSKERDPCLTEGRGYFVDDGKLAAHLEAHKGKRQEVWPSTK